jgi:hypothetical protein
MNFFKKLSFLVTVFTAFFVPSVACAANIVDALDLSPFVPLVLDSMMMVATGVYEFFVGTSEHTGIIYILIWTFLGLTIVLSLVKMYLPKTWVSFFGFSGGGDMADGKMTPTKIFENVLKPGLRAVIASLALLQLKPVYLTQWLINPFLEFGSIYTSHILSEINQVNVTANKVACPEDIVAKAWISKDSCEFLTQPVADLSHANNQIIKQGFESITNGLRGLFTLIPHGGEDFLNLVTGLILVFTFVGCNIFMALLVVQGIFNFGAQLILYPFYVLTYVFKSSDKWFDVWPAFSGITKALQQLIVTMIACAFILCINVAIIRALFQWNSSIFVVAAGGTATSNIPQQVASSSLGFGQHSVLWLSAIMTFYLMFKIFELTRKQLDMYVGRGMDGLYNNVTKDTKTLWEGSKKLGEQIGTAAGWIKKK